MWMQRRGINIIHGFRVLSSVATRGALLGQSNKVTLSQGRDYCTFFNKFVLEIVARIRHFSSHFFNKFVLEIVARIRHFSSLFQTKVVAKNASHFFGWNVVTHDIILLFYMSHCPKGLCRVWHIMSSILFPNGYIFRNVSVEEQYIRQIMWHTRDIRDI
jgi:hypothetical protein